MNRKYRKTIIAGNWKMNKLPSEIKPFADDLRSLIPRSKWCEIVICVPYALLFPAIRVFKDTRVAIGAQNMHHEKRGAYTGEVSAENVVSLSGAPFSRTQPAM